MPLNETLLETALPQAGSNEDPDTLHCLDPMSAIRQPASHAQLSACQCGASTKQARDRIDLGTCCSCSRYSSKLACSSSALCTDMMADSAASEVYTVGDLQRVGRVALLRQIGASSSVCASQSCTRTKAGTSAQQATLQSARYVSRECSLVNAVSNIVTCNITPAWHRL